MKTMGLTETEKQLERELGFRIEVVNAVPYSGEHRLVRGEAVHKTSEIEVLLWIALRAERTKSGGLEAHLAKCYRLFGADPDGNEDWRLAPHAVEEVRRLRQESDKAEASAAAPSRITHMRSLKPPSTPPQASPSLMNYAQRER